MAWACSKRLWQNAPSILFHKSTENFVVVKLQLWHHSVSAAVINPTAFLPHYTSHCTSEDDTFPILSYRSLARTGRYVLGTSITGVGSVATSTRYQVAECVLVCYRKWVMPLTAKCLQLVLTDTLCPWNSFSGFSRDVSTIPVHVSARSVRVHVRHRARTSRSITPSTRVTWTRTQLLLFVLRFTQAISFR